MTTSPPLSELKLLEGSSSAWMAISTASASICRDLDNCFFLRRALDGLFFFFDGLWRKLDYGLWNLKPNLFELCFFESMSKSRVRLLQPELSAFWRSAAPILEVISIAEMPGELVTAGVGSLDGLFVPLDAVRLKLVPFMPIPLTLFANIFSFNSSVSLGSTFK